jgi:hypothetical protein
MMILINLLTFETFASSRLRQAQADKKKSKNKVEVNQTLFLEIIKI